MAGRQVSRKSSNHVLSAARWYFPLIMLHTVTKVLAVLTTQEGAARMRWISDLDVDEGG